MNRLKHWHAEMFRVCVIMLSVFAYVTSFTPLGESLNYLTSSCYVAKSTASTNRFSILKYSNPAMQLASISLCLASNFCQLFQ